MGLGRDDRMNGAFGFGCKEVAMVRLNVAGLIIGAADIGHHLEVKRLQEGLHFRRFEAENPRGVGDPIHHAFGFGIAGAALDDALKNVGENNLTAGGGLADKRQRPADR